MTKRKTTQFPTHKRFSAGDRIRWAFSQGQEHDLSMVQRFTLIALAFYANQKTLESWPAVKTIALDIGARRETVQRALKQLEKDKLIKRVMHNTSTGRASNSYVLNIKRLELETSAVSKRMAAAERASIEQANRELGIVDNSNPQVTDDHLGCDRGSLGLVPVDNHLDQAMVRDCEAKNPLAQVTQDHTEQNIKKNRGNQPAAESAWLPLMTPIDNDKPGN